MAAKQLTLTYTPQIKTTLLKYSTYPEKKLPFTIFLSKRSNTQAVPRILQHFALSSAQKLYSDANRLDHIFNKKNLFTIYIYLLYFMFCLFNVLNIFLLCICCNKELFVPTASSKWVWIIIDIRYRDSIIIMFKKFANFHFRLFYKLIKVWGKRNSLLLCEIQNFI